MAVTPPIVPGAEAWSHEGTSASGALCLHGFTGSPASMRGLAEAFAAAGFHVELPRLPGHGTTVEEMMTTSWADWLAEADAAYERLAQRSESVVVAGLSMGGTLALWMAARHPETAGLVCVNPATQPQSDEVVAMVRGMIDEGDTMVPGIGSDIAQPGVVENAYPATPLEPLLSLVEEGVRPLAGQLDGLTTPMLLITSVNDHVVEPVQSDFLADAYGGAVERMVLQRSYHVATLDYDRHDIEAAAVEFARKVTAGHG